MFIYKKNPKIAQTAELIFFFFCQICLAHACNIFVTIFWHLISSFLHSAVGELLLGHFNHLT